MLQTVKVIFLINNKNIFRLFHIHTYTYINIDTLTMTCADIIHVIQQCRLTSLLVHKTYTETIKSYFDMGHAIKQVFTANPEQHLFKYTPLSSRASLSLR